ncbi:hypothetical protein NDU88_001640 [Pleurodeles waltl]|uniref:Uncharacterized protein n=1 Tax=Pleurodeles waltl TaxID=8319 RepID=A0AAV7LI02_PLEWA|nr:hypothetical protein NDU88_001640 [Pleurodeles waltl]
MHGSNAPHQPSTVALKRSSTCLLPSLMAHTSGECALASRQHRHHHYPGKQEIELAKRRLSVSSLRYLPLGVLEASLIGASNDEELVWRGGSSEGMPYDDPVAVGIQGDVDEPDLAQRQDYDPL